MTACLFCRIRDGEIPSKKVYEDEQVIAFHDLYPKAPLHVLIVPRKHIATINELEESDAELVGRLFLAAKKIAADAGYGDGYRVLMNCGEKGGQVIFHMHLHLTAGFNDSSRDHA
ncbi:histidine triad nucleotide-binding protein [uncultured Thiothrix sp.]|uniref:histidine triad nucleotide-binding protein n=1 Tax=uncultured Thiothrix sp. TaxID=223185 RepID=UPI002613E07D|nr:histidine triad nucleotide-binding protein [uncultured Thiothrix sp.]